MIVLIVVLVIEPDNPVEILLHWINHQVVGRMKNLKRTKDNTFWLKLQLMEKLITQTNLASLVKQLLGYLKKICHDLPFIISNDDFGYKQDIKKFLCFQKLNLPIRLLSKKRQNNKGH